ncbi:MAG: primosomal protein N' (replication factor Y) - superfamily II helicase [Rhodobacteraceae bacterium]|nr:primosomal protein N' (replication factor Y) - superfamily II helicase [Paracoccaceae bacterium]
MTTTAATPPAKTSTAEHRFPCDTCGADLRYEPGARALNCDYCGNSQSVAPAAPVVSAIRELDFAKATSGQLSREEMEETRVLSCAGCGAQVEFEPDIHAAECPFCATPVVTDTGRHRHIKPRGVLPFVLNEGAARDAMSDWLGGLWFAPSKLQQYARKGRRMQGIYVPYWTFDADTRSRYSGERGTVYYETVTVHRDGKPERRQVARIRWSPASGQVARAFDDVLVLASKSLPKHFTEGLEPWDLGGLQPYSPQFLAGFRAEGYQVLLEDGFVEARDKMDEIIARDVRFAIGGDQQRIHDIDTDVRDVTFKHVLLPVWMAAYKYRGKTYRCVVNGRSGRVQGERPYSAIKIAFAVVLGLIVAAAMGYLWATT